ncbi:hypothetical protein L6164_019644 [Bauhinia variegata]|uniref:Uncharacterized protein n=1 Tax=Bauhinia variegata TaxID=167791 RepID=A0ACB9MSE8_BAUVA|nr:hypothetical protein L6164_019644 [Bauhinia variegata]
MLPPSYAFDSVSKSKDLASTIVASSTPSQIISTCAAIDSFLLSHSPDQSRHFFTITFPTLICKLFGFDDTRSCPSLQNSCSGWIDTVISTNDTDLANRIFSLLSLDGILINSIFAVDRLSLVKYVFPTERLPEWTRSLLSGDKDAMVLSELCPLFKGKVKEDTIKSASYQIQLNVLEYYLFWFAYFPVCRGKSENSDHVSVKRARRFRLENWTSSIPGFSIAKRGVEQKIECNIYIRILYAYLREFVPTYDLNVHQVQPYRSSLLHYASGFDGTVIMRAEFLVNTMIHFWLVDNDLSPLPLNLCKPYGVSFPLRSLFGETPPTPGLGEVVKLLVKYLNLSTVTAFEGSEDSEYFGSSRWKAMGSRDAMKSKDATTIFPSVRLEYWNPLIQRPLYRFLLRTFLFFPVATSIKNASQVFSVWINYMEPWRVKWDDFSELNAITNGSALNERKEDSLYGSNGYTCHWQDYVLSNYLYYSSLVIHFIGFAHKFLNSDVKTIVPMVLEVLDTLTSLKELIDLLRNVDTLQDWEDGLCETDADGSYLHEHWNKDLRLFSDGEDDGQQLLQLFILRAEAELQAIGGDNLSPSLQCIDSLKARLGCLFDGHTIKSSLSSPEPAQHEHQQSRDEIFKPRRAGNPAFTDFKYKGDRMKRPTSSDEIAWLAKLLVRLSAWLNESLGLNQAESSPAGLAWSYMEVSSDLGNVWGFSETVKF